MYMHSHHFCCFLDIAWILTCGSLIVIGDIRGGIFTLHMNRGILPRIEDGDLLRGDTLGLPRQVPSA